MLIAKCNYCGHDTIYSKSHIELHIVRDYIESFDLNTGIVFVSSCGQSWTLKYAFNQPYPLTPMIIDRQQDKAEAVYFMYDNETRPILTSYNFARLAKVLKNDAEAKCRLKQQ